MLNIRTRAAVDTLTFQLVDAADEPLFNEDGSPCNAVIYGPGSKRYAAAQAAKQARWLDKLNTGKGLKLTPAESARQQAEFLAAITESINLAYVDDQGHDLQGHDKLLAIYSDTSIGFIAEQVTKKAGDWANFLPGSATS